MKAFPCGCCERGQKTFSEGFWILLVSHTSSSNQIVDWCWKFTECTCLPNNAISQRRNFHLAIGSIGEVDYWFGHCSSGPMRTLRAKKFYIISNFFLFLLIQLGTHECCLQGA